VELVVSRVAVLGLVRLRKSRIERRRLQLFIRARVRLVSPRTSRTSITHRSHASKSSLSLASRVVSRRLARTSNAVFSAVFSAAASTVYTARRVRPSVTPDHARARARIITDPIARVSLARTRVVRFHPSRASETYADHRARLPTPLARVSLDSTPPSRRLARTSTTVSIASARTASSLDIVRPLPLVPVVARVRSRAREGGSSTRSVGRSRSRASFA